TLEQIGAFIEQDVRELAGADAAQGVIDVWQRYLALQRHHFQSPVSLQDRSTWAPAFAERQQLRRQILGLELAQAFYADEERQFAALLQGAPAAGATTPRSTARSSAPRPWRGCSARTPLGPRGHRSPAGALRCQRGGSREGDAAFVVGWASAHAERWWAEAHPTHPPLLGVAVLAPLPDRLPHQLRLLREARAGIADHQVQADPDAVEQAEPPVLALE